MKEIEPERFIEHIICLKKFALVLTHDVDTAAGLEKSQTLMELEDNLEFKSSFNFVPERYKVPEALRHLLVNRGMVLLNTHPDYMNFNFGPIRNEEYPADYYIYFLKHIKEKYKGRYWHVLPKEISTFWKKQN